MRTSRACSASLLLLVLVAACGSSPPAAPRAPSAIPYIAQIHTLSCEAASLQMIAASRGVKRDQDQILKAIGIDARPPELAADGTVARWGNPNLAFVGSPDGSETKRTGYGTYAGPIARVAIAMVL